MKRGLSTRGGFAGRARRGVTLVEALIAAIIFTFVISAAGALFSKGQQQQQLAQSSSQPRQDVPEALRRVTRAIRHGYWVVGSNTSPASTPSTCTALTSANRFSDTSSQVVVAVPEPSGTSPSKQEIRFYLSGTS